MLLRGLFFRLRLHGIPVVDRSLPHRRQAGAADPHLAGERHLNAMLLQHPGDGFVPRDRPALPGGGEGDGW